MFKDGTIVDLLRMSLKSAESLSLYITGSDSLFYILLILSIYHSQIPSFFVPLYDPSCSFSVFLCLFVLFPYPCLFHLFSTPLEPYMGLILCHSLYLYLPVSPSVPLFLCLSFSIFVSFSIFPSHHLYISLPIYLPTFLPSKLWS